MDNSNLSNQELFAEKFQKFTVRDFNNNTRMNIKNAEFAQRKIIRDRAIDYWQNNVIQNHLPPIDYKKRAEMQELRRQASIVSRGGNKPDF